MINRTKLTIKLYQGDEYNRRITLTDDNDVPYDLSGYGAVMEIRPVIRERDKTGKWTGVNSPMLRLEKGDGLTLDDQGNIDIFVSSERSYNLPSGQFKYDLELIDDASVHTILYGDVRIIGEVTDSESPYLEFSETYKGLPGGGTTGQHLTKASDEPYDAEWTDVPAGDGNGTPGKDGEGVPEGGTTGQILAKVDDVDFNTEWVDQADGGDVELPDNIAYTDEENIFSKTQQIRIDSTDGGVVGLSINHPGTEPTFKVSLNEGHELGSWAEYQGRMHWPTDIVNKGYVDGVVQPLIDRIGELEARLDKCCPPPPATTIVVSNKELTWADLPARGQADNGSLTLIDSQVRENVPVVVETGRMLEEIDGVTKEVAEVPEVEVLYDTRATFTYEADFDWHAISNQQLTWLVDVLQFKDNKLKNSDTAFMYMAAAQLTALPDLDWQLNGLYRTFYQCKAFNQDLSTLDVSKVQGFSQTFRHASAFNGDITDWDTSSATNMDSTLSYTKADQDLSGWCVENVTISSNFATGTPMANNAAKLPQWGVPC